MSEPAVDTVEAAASTESDPRASTECISAQRIPAWMITTFAIMAVVAVVWNVAAIPWSNPFYGLFENYTDLRVYRAGAQCILDGRPLYAGAVLWDLDFTYPPFAAGVFIPFALLPLPWAAAVWWISSYAALVALIVVSFRSLNYRCDARLLLGAALLAVGATALEPIRTTVWLGQINVFLVLLVVWDLSRAGGRTRGMGVGVAAGLKLTPAFFLLYLALTRRWRVLAVAAGTFAATIAVGFVLIGGEAWRYWANDVSGAARVGRVDSPANQSVHGFFSQMLAYFDIRRFLAHPSSGPPVFEAPAWLWVPAALLVGGLGLWAAVVAARSGRRLLAITIVGMSSCAVSPFAWGHHWVWFVPLLVICLDAVNRADNRTRRWLVTLPAGLIALSFTYVYNAFRSGPHLTSDHAIALGLFMMPRHSPEKWWNAVPATLYAGCYPLVLLVTIVVTLLAVRAHGHSTSTRCAEVSGPADNMHDERCRPVAQYR